MLGDIVSYEPWVLVLITSVIFALLAYSFFEPRTSRE
jgi:hypothetical protein